MVQHDYPWSKILKKMIQRYSGSGFTWTLKAVPTFKNPPISQKIFPRNSDLSDLLPRFLLPIIQWRESYTKLLALLSPLLEAEPNTLHTRVYTQTRIHTKKHISNYITQVKDIDTLLKIVGAQAGFTLLSILLRNFLKALKTSQCIQLSFSLAVVVFSFSSLQNPSSGADKMVILFQLFSTGRLSSGLFPFPQAIPIFSFAWRKI